MAYNPRATTLILTSKDRVEFYGGRTPRGLYYHAVRKDEVVALCKRTVTFVIWTDAYDIRRMMKQDICWQCWKQLVRLGLV